MFLATMAMFIVLALVQAFATSVGWLVVIRFLLGVPLGSDISNGYTYIMESMPKGKPTATRATRGRRCRGPASPASASAWSSCGSCRAGCCDAGQWGAIRERAGRTRTMLAG